MTCIVLNTSGIRECTRLLWIAHQTGTLVSRSGCTVKMSVKPKISRWASFLIDRLACNSHQMPANHHSSRRYHTNAGTIPHGLSRLPHPAEWLMRGKFAQYVYASSYKSAVNSASCSQNVTVTLLAPISTKFPNACWGGGPLVITETLIGGR